MSRTRTDRTAFVSTAATSLALPLAAFVSSPLLARALGVTGRGVVAATLAPAGLATLLAPVGIPEASAFYSARFGAGRLLLLRGMRIGLVSGAIAAAVLVALLGVLTVNIPNTRIDYLLVALSLPVCLAQANLRGLATGSGQWRLANRERIVAVLVRLVPLVVLFCTGALTVRLAIVLTWWSGVVSLLVYIPFIRRTLRADEEVLPVPFRDYVRYGAKVWVSGLSGIVVLRLDQVFLAVVSSPRELGLYVIAVAIAEVPQTAVGSVQQLVLSRVAAGADAMMVARTSSVAFVLTASAVVVVGLAVPLALPWIFGEAFSEAVPVAELLLFATLPLVLITVHSGVLLGADRGGSVALAKGAAAVATIACLVLFLPRYGALGAAFVSAVVYCVLAAVLVALAHRVHAVAVVALLVPDRGTFMRLRGGR